MGELKRLIISCGGTGGHFLPGLSIARTFQQQGGKVLLLLSGVNSASQVQSAAACGIDAVALPLMPSVKRNPFKFIAGSFSGCVKSWRIIKEFKPQAVLGMGSFSMVPILGAALLHRVPIALHDGNARIGRANRWSTVFAKVLGAGFPAVNADKCRCRVVDTGMPVRPELLEKYSISRAEALNTLNELYNSDLKEELTTVLVFGGSQGAAVFNSILPQAFLRCRERNFQVLHLCGKGKSDEAQALYDQADFPVLLLEFSDRMEYFLGAADAVFCRSGGSTLAELALFGKGAFLIPYPYASEGHQQDNAEYFERNDAAKIINNSGLTVEKALELMESDICGDRKNLENRGKAAANLARPDAAIAMLKEISAIIR